MQFDTGSAIVYVLTDKCSTKNKSPKFKSKTDTLAVKSPWGNEDNIQRMEYGYGSGYINGQIETEKICFS